jgi:hypothetical protein
MVTARVIVKTATIAAPVLVLIWMASLGRLGVPETMWLAVWAIGLVDLARRIAPVTSATLSPARRAHRRL